MNTKLLRELNGWYLHSYSDGRFLVITPTKVELVFLFKENAERFMLLDFYKNGLYDCASKPFDD